MKKSIKFILVFLLGVNLFFNFNTKVTAATAVCKYDAGGGIFTLTAKDNSVRSSYVEKANSKFNSSGSVETINYSLFYSDDEKCNLKCPALYLETVGSGRNVDYKLHGSSKGLADEINPSEKSTINNNDCNNNDNEENTTGNDTIMAVCKYNAGGGEYTIIASNNSVSTIFTSSVTGGSATGESESFNYNLFYADDEKCNLKCPTLYLETTGSGRNVSNKLYSSKVSGSYEVSPNANSNIVQGTCPEPDDTQGGNPDPIGPGKEFENCTDLFGENSETFNLLKESFRAITIVAPIIVIVLSIMDFIKAVAASDDKAIKEAQSKFVKRLVICVLIFFLPNILKILFNLVGNQFGICDIA